MTLIVGITGVMGSSKSTVARTLNERFGVPVFDADSVAKEPLHTAEFRNSIVAITGPDVIENGVFNVEKLSALLFSDDQKYDRYAALIAMHLWREFDIWKKSHKGTVPYIVLDAALIYEFGWEGKCNYIVATRCLEGKRLWRLKKYRGFTAVAVQQRMARQIAQKEKCDRADYVLDTSCRMRDLQVRVKRLHAFLLGKSEVHHGAS
jgi:dephospho-CoA kinase